MPTFLNPALYGCLQIRNSALCYYLQNAEPRERSKKQKFSFDEMKPSYSGEISKLSKKNISRSIQLLLQSSPLKWYINPITGKRNHHRITFITLTFSCSELLNLNEQYNLSLKPFLRWLTETKKVKNYVWKAEYQQRGQLHYHITTNEFIRYDEIKMKWNYIQKQNGYLDEYFSKFGNYNPNSTDVHAVYKIANIESYLIKYMMKPTVKEEGNNLQPIYKNQTSGKVWGCSENLRGKQYFTIEYVNDEQMEALESKVKNKKLKIIEGVENCSFWKIENGKDYGEIVSDELKKQIEDFAKSEFKKTTDFLNNKT